MKQLEVKQAITYRWWRNDKKPIKPAHVEALKETAMERIAKMMADGYTSGELSDCIHMSKWVGVVAWNDGVEYTGWWEVSA